MALLLFGALPQFAENATLTPAQMRAKAKAQNVPEIPYVEVRSEGNFIREIGEGLYGFAFAHAVRVDSQDNIWAVDEGTNMVITFNPEGNVLMVLGHRPESVFGIPITPGFRAPPPAAEPYTFNRPTDVARDSPDNIFVAAERTNSMSVRLRNGECRS